MRLFALSTVIPLLFTLQIANAEATGEGEESSDSSQQSLVGAERYSSDDIGRRREGEALKLSLIDAIRLGLKNNLAIQIDPCAWLSATPTSGTIPPGGQQIVDLQIDTKNLFPGHYSSCRCWRFWHL